MSGFLCDCLLTCWFVRVLLLHAPRKKRSDLKCLVWSALALPTLKTVLPKLRRGADVLTDNTISGAEGYKDLLTYLRAPENGFHTVTLPYSNGFEMSVYMPQPERA